VIYTESHDEVANGKARVPHEISPETAADVFAQKRSTLGAGLVFTAPGIPMIFQGQEFLAGGWFDDSRMLDWERLDQFAGIAALYRDLIALRRNGQGTTRGLSGQGSAVYHVNAEAKVIAFHRWHEGGPADSTVVVANLGGQIWHDYWVGMPVEGLWRVRFNSDWEGYSQAFANTHTTDVTAVAEAQDGQPCRGALTIGPYSLVILSQQR
jgi:1,4-alpha-glucan branching enzyme